MLRLSVKHVFQDSFAVVVVPTWKASWKPIGPKSVALVTFIGGGGGKRAGGRDRITTPPSRVPAYKKISNNIIIIIMFIPECVH